MTQAILFSAPSGYGKTTIIMAIIPYLSKSGIKVGYVKHHHGEYYKSKKKDTGKMLDVGITKSLLIANDIVIIEEPIIRKRDYLKYYVNSFFQGYHLVIIEGFKENKSYPKIVILRKSLDIKGEWFRKILLDKNIIAIISDDILDVPYPTFSFNEKEKLCNFILEYFNLKPKK